MKETRKLVNYGKQFILKGSLYSMKEIAYGGNVSVSVMNLYVLNYRDHYGFHNL